MSFYIFSLSFFTFQTQMGYDGNYKRGREWLYNYAISEGYKYN